MRSVPALRFASVRSKVVYVRAGTTLAVECRIYRINENLNCTGTVPVLYSTGTGIFKFNFNFNFNFNLPGTHSTARVVPART